MPKNKNLGFEIKNLNTEEGTAELYIYGDIVSDRWYEDEVSPSQIKDALASVENLKRIDMYINSPGGSVFAGVAMYSILNRSEAHIVAHIDGIAASAATYPVMAADEIDMPENTMLMIHKPLQMMVGNADDLRGAAEALDKVEGTVVAMYAARFKNLDEDKIRALMTAETFITAADAVEFGLIESVGELKSFKTSQVENKLVVNGVEFDAKNIKNLPENFSGEAAKGEEEEIKPEAQDYSYYKASMELSEILTNL